MAHHISADGFITRPDGSRFPAIGYGTFQLRDTAATAAAVTAALDAGYRLIDTAADYGNEAGVGAGVRMSDVPRSDIVVSSKVWPKDLGYDATLRAFEHTIANLNLDYLDLYLIHWPCSRELNAASWQALERLQSEQRVRAIGVSNFTIAHLQALFDTATVAPLVNQVEYHPWQFDPALHQFCTEHDILVEAWSPLMQGAAFTDETLTRIAQKHRRSAAQVALRWSVQQGAIPLPKTRSPERMRENFAVFDFRLNADDMAAIAAMHSGKRLGPDPDSYPFCSKESA